MASSQTLQHFHAASAAPTNTAVEEDSVFTFRSKDFETLDSRADVYARLKGYLKYGGRYENAKRHFIIKDTIRMLRENDRSVDEIKFDFTVSDVRYLVALKSALRVTDLSIEKISISYYGTWNTAGSTPQIFFDAISSALRNKSIRLNTLNVFVEKGGDYPSLPVAFGEFCNELARSNQPLEHLNIRLPQHIWKQPYHNTVSYLVGALKKTKCPIQRLVFNELVDGDKRDPIIGDGAYFDVKNLKDVILNGEILCPLRYVKMFDTQLSAYSDIQRKLGIIPKCASEFDLYVKRLGNNDNTLDDIRLQGVDLSCADIKKLMKLLTKTSCPIRRIDLSYIRMPSASILDIAKNDRKYQNTFGYV